MIEKVDSFSVEAGDVVRFKSELHKGVGRVIMMTEISIVIMDKTGGRMKFNKNKVSLYRTADAVSEISALSYEDIKQDLSDYLEGKIEDVSISYPYLFNLISLT